MLTVVGPSPSVDITYVVDDYRLGEIHRPTVVARCAGGKALNMARAASRLGAEVALVTVLGGATGSWIAEQLAVESVTTVAVAAEAETRTCVSVSSTATGTLTEVYEHAPEIPATTWQQLLGELDRLLPIRPGWLSTSGSTPKGLPDSALADLVRLGHRHGVRVAVDTHGPALGPALEARPALVKINRAEAAGELGVDPDGDLAAMAAELCDRTGGAVVLTDGAAGALALADGVLVRASLPGVHGHFPVGSGDSFLGGFLARWDAGADLAECLRTGMACGAANALVPGAARFEAAEAARLTALVVESP